MHLLTYALRSASLVPPILLARNTSRTTPALRSATLAPSLMMHIITSPLLVRMVLIRMQMVGNPTGQVHRNKPSDRTCHGGRRPTPRLLDLLLSKYLYRNRSLPRELIPPFRS